MHSRPLRQEEMKGLLAEELRRGAVGKGIIRWRRCGPLLLRDRGKGIRRTINGCPSAHGRASLEGLRVYGSWWVEVCEWLRVGNLTASVGAVRPRRQKWLAYVGVESTVQFTAVSKLRTLCSRRRAPVAARGRFQHAISGVHSCQLHDYPAQPTLGTG